MTTGFEPMLEGKRDGNHVCMITVSFVRAPAEARVNATERLPKGR